MKLHRTTTKFNCGIDLHAQNMYACIMDQTGKKVLHQNIKGNDFGYFLKIAAPYVHDLTLACESTFNWYWLADACEEAGIKFVLGHVLYMRAIHGTKTKNDRVDSEKIAHLLRSNMLPEGYCISPEKRPIRDLLRRRIYLVRRRSGLLCHMSESVQIHGQDPLTRPEKRKSERHEIVPERFVHPALKCSMKVDTFLAHQYDLIIKEIEKEVLKHTRLLASKEYALLKTTPGIGQTLGLVILYEIDDIDRFQSVGDFCSYSRLTPVKATSNGKVVGQQGRKMGNHYLKWAFTQAALIGKRDNKFVRDYIKKQEAKYGKRKANAMLAHQFGRAVFHMLKNDKVFNVEKFLKGKIDFKKIKDSGRCHKADIRTVSQNDSECLAACQ